MSGMVGNEPETTVRGPGAFSSIGEPLRVEVAARQAQVPEMALDRVHHPGGPAQVDVVARDVRDEPADRLSPERVDVGVPVVASAPVTDDVQDTGAPVPGELLDL